MIVGFALLAYPAEYGVSGIMTFVVNQQGILYEKDLGTDTEKLAGNLRTYDPDDTWQKVTPTSPAH
jgi:type II restriction/modification system DNA methylase subunit YeeA